MNKDFSALAAVSSAAAPWVGQGASVPTDTVSQYRYSQYREDDAPASRVFAGDTERYSIDVHQLRHARPLADDWYVSGDFQYETLSGASPWKTYQNNQGQSVLIMSGASGEGIEETRIDVSGKAQRYFDDAIVGGQPRILTEKDYQSISLGPHGTLAQFQHHTTLTMDHRHHLHTTPPTQQPQ